MTIEELATIIARRDPMLANAVSQMVGYVKERFPAAYPSKEQTEAVNTYFDRVCPTSQRITIVAIRALDHHEQGRLQDVLDHIAYDRDYYMPERRQGLHL